MAQGVSPEGAASSAEYCLFLEDHTRTEGYIAIIAESFRPSYPAIQPMLASLAEPISRPALIHEYHLTPFSLGAAVSNGVTPEEAMSFLGQHSYDFVEAATNAGGAQLHRTVQAFIESCMGRYNRARVVIENDRTVVQCKDVDTAQLLLSDAVVRSTVCEPVEVSYETFVWKDETGQYPCFLLRNRAMAKVVSARCVLLGLPIQQQYDYEHDPSVRSANISLRSQTKPRRYQVEAVEAATGDGILNSGCLLLPCGAGKTLLGIMLMCKVKKPTLVVCAGAVSVEQWKNQILEYATLEPPEADVEGSSAAHQGRAAQRQTRSGATRISCLTGKQKDEIDEDTDVVLTTYSMLVTAHRMQARKQAQLRAAKKSEAATNEPDFTTRGARKRRTDPKERLFAPYGLLILDEVHVIPADAFRESLSFVDAKGVIGLTATYVREDHRIMDLFHLVGPKLFDVSMETLAAQGYLAKVNCIEVHTPMTKEFGLEYMERSAQTSMRQKTGHVPVLIMLAAANPNKMLCVRELVQRHLESGAKILVFCDHIMLLHEYGKLLNAPVICGQTQHKDRLMIFSDFQSTSKINVICISRVGDVSVNLPSANVVVQVSSHGGSRRQEAQRLGRILRPKDKAANGKTVEAWFYSIISMDTLEMAYAAHRTAFLVDQGYTCRLMEFNPALAEATAEAAQTSSLSTTAGPAAAVKQSPKDEVVGDAVSIKQEALHRGGNVLAQRPRGAPGAALRAMMDEVRTLPYQLQLLSRVVSNWEMQYQLEARHAKTRAARGGPDGRSDDDDDRLRDASSDESVTEVVADRTIDKIKKEWAAEGGPAYSRQRGALPIRELVGVDDGFVYHEL